MFLNYVSKKTYFNLIFLKKGHKTKRAQDQNIIKISMQQSYTKLSKRSKKYVMEI